MNLLDGLIPDEIKLAACLTIVLPTLPDDPRVTAAWGHLRDGRPRDALAEVIDLLPCPDRPSGDTR